MTQTLFVHCSPHGVNTYGYQLVRELLGYTRWFDKTNTIVERNLTAEPLPPINNLYATALTNKTAAEETHFVLSEQLINELENSDRLLIALPMHNFTVPATFKLWIDYVVRANRSFSTTGNGKVGILGNRPTAIFVSSGGFHRGKHATTLQPDFLSPYVRCVLATIGIEDVSFHYLQGLTHGEAALSRALGTVRERLTTIGPWVDSNDAHQHL